MDPHLVEQRGRHSEPRNATPCLQET